VILVALPFAEPGVETRAVYDEPFFGRGSEGPPWRSRKRVTSDELSKESLLLPRRGPLLPRPGARDLPYGESQGAQRARQDRRGGSLETIRQMVAGGVGVTVLPATSTASGTGRGRPDPHPAIRAPDPDAARRHRLAAQLSRAPKRSRRCAKAILACNLPQVEKLAN
jgi:LysR family hydrogen peroxide-inducible transcriptional activator